MKKFKSFFKSSSHSFRSSKQASQARDDRNISFLVSDVNHKEGDFYKTVVKTYDATLWIKIFSVDPLLREEVLAINDCFYKASFKNSEIHLPTLEEFMAAMTEYDYYKIAFNRITKFEYETNYLIIHLGPSGMSSMEYQPLMA